MFKNSGTTSPTYQNSILKQQLTLLEKKDQQIRRLQSQLDQQRRKAQNSMKMLQSYKSIHTKFQDCNISVEIQTNKRLKLQEQLKKQKNKNELLKQAIKKYITYLKQSDTPDNIQNISENIEKQLLN